MSNIRDDGPSHLHVVVPAWLHQEVKALCARRPREDRESTVRGLVESLLEQWVKRERRKAA